MRKLIEKVDNSQVVCDNPKCNYMIKYEKHNLTLDYFINAACPRCGENLLTVKDYQDYLTVLKMVDWINRWFSWITLFYRKSPKNTSKVGIHVHDGLTILKK